MKIVAVAIMVFVFGCGKGNSSSPDSGTDRDFGTAEDSGDYVDTSGTRDIGQDLRQPDTDDSTDMEPDASGSGFADGEPCETDSECGGGTCLAEWSGGYCTTQNCEDAEDCAQGGNDNRCLVSAIEDNFCVRYCDAIDDCRRGYRCQSAGAFSYCAPDPSVVIDPAPLESLPYTVTCLTAVGNAVSYDFSVGQNATSYQVIPFNIFGDRVDPQSIDLPDNTQVDFLGANAFQIVNDPDFIQATTIPATNDFGFQVMSGAHTYRLTTNSFEACFYLVEENAPGTVIDLNIHFVGIPGLTSATAPQHADFQIMLTQLDQILTDAGFARGTTQFIDVGGQDAIDFAVIRDVADLYRLAAISEQPESNVLSANVFYVQSFAIGSIGFSSALPGPAGLHGTDASGVILTGEFFGQMPTDSFGNQHDGNLLIAQITAHELGHFLGLFHTSENTGATHDPLGDTPECFVPGLNCPDVNNLMFFAAGDSRVNVTPNQAFVMGAHPLTK